MRYSHRTNNLTETVAEIQTTCLYPAPKTKPVTSQWLIWSSFFVTLTQYDI